jgi:hypothetical protein
MRIVSLYHRHRFPSEIISHCVWLYFRFSLSDLLKLKFARVRMPLAKFEAASKFPTDHDYLSQTVGGPTGWGWIVADRTVIYRNELADEVLRVFDKFEDTKASLLFQKQLALAADADECWLGGVVENES